MNTSFAILYTGVVLGAPWLGPALGSWLAALPLVAFAGLVIRRLLVEERVLREHLPGYEEYARQVGWRLIPGLW